MGKLLSIVFGLFCLGWGVLVIHKGRIDGQNPPWTPPIELKGCPSLFWLLVLLLFGTGVFFLLVGIFGLLQGK